MEIRLKRFPDRWYFFGFLPFLSCLPKPLAYWMARTMGRRFYRIHRSNREEILKNLKAVFGIDPRWASQIAWIARSTFETIAFEDLEPYFFRFWTAADINRLFQFQGLRHLDEALAKGRGALLCTGHQAGIGAAMVALGLKGYPFTHIGREFLRESSFPPAFRDYAVQKLGWMYDRLGRPLIHVHPSPDERRTSSASAVLETYRTLLANRFVSMALDVVPDMVAETQEVKFLGQRARFPTNAVQLAYACQVPIIHYLPIRDRKYPYRQRIRISPPVSLTGALQVDVQKCVDPLETIIREYPEQWWGWDSLVHFWNVEKGS